MPTQRSDNKCTSTPCFQLSCTRTSHSATSGQALMRPVCQKERGLGCPPSAPAEHHKQSSLPIVLRHMTQPLCCIRSQGNRPSAGLSLSRYRQHSNPILESYVAWLAHPKAVVPTTCIVMSPRRRWMSTGRPALAATARLRINSSAASFMSEEYASRLQKHAMSSWSCLARLVPHVQNQSLDVDTDLSPKLQGTRDVSKTV